MSLRPLRTLIPLLVLLFAAGLQGACGSAPRPVPLRRVRPMVPPQINDSTFPAHVRRFQELPVTDKQRTELRAGLVEHLRTKTQAILDAGAYEAVVEHFIAFTSLYTPSEIADGILPRALQPVCEYLIDTGSPRGDEARVLSALLVLHQLQPDAGHHDYYKRLRTWSIETRSAGLGSPFGLDDELIDVWSEHARMTPTPELLSQLARYHIDFRNALLQQFQSPERIMPMGREYYELVQRKAFDVAAVFLRHGDTASALSHLRAIGPAGNRDAQLLTLLERAQEDDDEGADALWALAHEAPYARGDKDVSEALCRAGHVEHPRDPRFPRCLATLAMLRDDLDAVLAYYMEALALSSDREPVYDELLAVLNQLLENTAPSSDAAQVRRVGQHIIDTLHERMAAFPDSDPPITADRVNILVALAEMNAGNAKEAETHLAASLAANPSIDAHTHMGNLLSRLGRLSEAQTHYRAALDLVDGDDVEALDLRATLHERLGDTGRLLGQREAARASYQAALELWDDLSHMLQGTGLSLAQVRRGVLLSRLDRKQASVAAFKSALEQARGAAETYKVILAHLVISEPDQKLALQVFRHALNQLRLEPEWKVYMALWLQIINSFESTPAERDAVEVLQDYSGDGSWWARLASFGAGQVGYDELTAEVSDAGQQAEALFYDGARRLARGDKTGARERFERVLETRMVNFYEYTMAQELLRRIGASEPKPAAPVDVAVEGSKAEVTRKSSERAKP